MKTPIEMTQDLVRLESTDPGTYEQNVADYIRDLLVPELPCEGKFLQVEVEPDRPVVMAVIPGRSEEKEDFVIISHMDTVPIAEGWTCDPLGAEIRGGKLFGRGSCDMKSGLACALYAFLQACERAKTCGLPERTIKFIGTMDEEADMKGAGKVIELGWVDEHSLVMDTEPTGGEIQTAHKGRYWFSWIMHGKAAHASQPWTGADAISAMAYAITWARQEVDALDADELCGKSTITFGMIEGGVHPYQVPGECKVSVDMRLVPACKPGKAREILQAASDYAKEFIPGVEPEIIETGSRPAVGHYETGLLRYLSQHIEKVTGSKPVVSAFPGYTDTAVIAGITGSKTTLSYGPGNLTQAHKPDEFVELKDIERCAAVYTSLLSDFFSLT